MDSHSWADRVCLCVGGSIDGWVFVDVCASTCGCKSMRVCEGSCLGGGMWSYVCVGETVKLFVGLCECVGGSACTDV